MDIPVGSNVRDGKASTFFNPVFECYSDQFLKITIRTIDIKLIWYHFLNSGVTHYCAAPTVQVGVHFNTYDSMTHRITPIRYLS